MSSRFIAIWYSLTGIEANRVSKGTAAAVGTRDKKANRGGVGAGEEGKKRERGSRGSAQGLLLLNPHKIRLWGR